jgi:hypothetical protein
MLEYIYIATFMLVMFFGASYLRKKYLEKYKWNKIVINTLPLIYFIYLFFAGYKKDSQTIIHAILLVILSFYCLYQIYKETRLFINNKKV